MRFDRPDLADESGDDRMPGHARHSPESPDAVGKDQQETAGDVLSGSRPALADPAVRAERAAAYRAVVDAVYRQYETGQGTARPEEPDRGAVADPPRRAGAGGSRPGAAADGGAAHIDNSPYCPVADLKGDEPATAERLLKAPGFTGETLRGFKGTDNPDFIDAYNRTYDAVGGPTAWASPRLDMARMLSQIHRHVYEKDGVDFTVVDLTGASSAQVGEVFDSIDKWEADPAMSAKSRIIILGDDY